MATSIVPGQKTWSMTRDSEGHRTYRITYRVRGDKRDGPATVIQTPGLPLVGSFWIVDNDVDLWAWCRADAEVQPVLEGEPNRLWDVTFTFSTKPITDKEGGGGMGGGNGGSSSGIEDPLLQPQKISGNFIKYTEQATTDATGRLLTNSAHQPLEGPALEFDANRPAVRIEQNVIQLGANVFSPMVDTVNANPLWGLPARTIKLSNVTWDKKYYGPGIPYYTRVLDFDIMYQTFDRVIIDKGTKVLKGHWDRTTGLWTLDKIAGRDPDPSNPTHFICAVDRYDNPTTLVLDGAGKPYEPLETGAISVDLLNAGAEAEAVPIPTLTFSKLSLMPLLNVGSTYQETSIGGPLEVLAPFTHWAFKFIGMPTGRIVVNIDRRATDKVFARVFTSRGKATRGSHRREGAYYTYNWNFDPTDSGSAVFDTEETDIMWAVLYSGSSAGGVNALDDDYEFTLRVEGDRPDFGPGKILVTKYRSSDFLLLGIPTIF